MGYKNINRHIGFADLALASSLKHNRSLKFMDKLNKTIDWSRVDQILMNSYPYNVTYEFLICNFSQGLPYYATTL